MVYSPPSGFVEPYSDPDPQAPLQRFHTRPDCPRIRNRDQLRPVDRPYSAVRCTGCADEHGNNMERFVGPPPESE
jgi:hypothetical protein